ncbi:hypothetical protein B9G55_07930 [Saccharibacillus sp. O16]|nr:hypothetical protein B9G55_07930 [Saccharibacillus sp. O16]
MRRKALSILLCISMVFPGFFAASFPASAASWSIGSNDSSWKAVYPANNQNDYLQDQQTGSGSVSQDIVGDATYPSTYMHLTDTEAAFRIRVSNANGMNPYEFKNFAFVGLDADLNGSVDLFLGAYNPTGNNGRLGLYASSSGYANTGPSTTGISGKPLLAFKPVSDSNYSITPTGDGSSFNGDADYFVSFKFALSDITAALAQNGIHNFNASTPFRFMTGTAAQDNAFNQDLNGMDKSGWSSTKTWNELGTFSNVTSANGNVAYYTVRFDSNTGDTTASPDFKVVEASGKTIGTLPTAPTKRGMYFMGWNTKADGTGTAVNASTVVSSDMTVYATWSDKQTYTVTFNPNGGNFSGSSTALVVPSKNGIIGDLMPTSPTQSNKYFMGWNTTSNGNGSWFNAFTAVTQNTTVYAQWASQANKSALFYNNFTSDGGALIATVYSNGNSNNFNGTLPSVVRTGYTLQGWYLNDKTGTGTAVTSITQEGNYYAKWVPANYTVTFNANAGSDSVSGMPASRNVTDGQFGTMPSAPTRTGYQFIEWNRAADGTSEAIYPSTLITANTTLYAIWKASQNITFDPNGGTGTAQVIPAVSGKLNFLPQPPSRDNYSFQGWGTSAGATTSVELKDVSSYSTLYAIWSPVYTVTFDTNGGQWTDGGSTTDILTAYGSVLYLPDVPERANYTFGGWNTQADGSGSSFTLSSPVTQQTRIYAVWTPVAGAAYTVEFDARGGSTVTSVTTNKIETLPTSTKPGYTLEGWYSDPELKESSKISFPYAVTSNLTLYAKWTALELTAVFNANAGKYANDLGEVEEKQIYDSKYVLPGEVPSRSGFTFASWNTDANGTGTTITSNTTVTTATYHTIYAVWTELGNITLNYATENANYGTVSRGSESLNPSTGQALGSTAQAKPGYQFVQWQDGSGKMVSQEATWTPQKIEGSYISESYTAVFKALNGRVTLDPNQGTGGSSSVNATYNEALPSAEPPSRPGYTFAGYYDQAIEGTLYYDANMNSVRLWDKTEAEVTLYAHWTEANQVTIRYAANNDQYGSVSRTEESLNPMTGEAQGATAQAKAGYRFVEWQNSEGIQVSDNKTLIPQPGKYGYAGAAYTAVFQAMTGTVILNDNGGSGGSGSIEAVYNQPMPAAKTPSRDRYTFDGYYDQLNGGVQYYNADLSSARSWDKTGSENVLYAHWSSERAVTGTVIDDDKPAKLVPTAIIKIVRGNEQYGDTAVTDANGKFTIYNIPAGTYNLIMTIGEKTEIIAITVKADEPVTELGKVIFPLSSASSVLKLKTPDTPPVVINNLHPEAEQYLADENNQGFVKVEMSVARTDETTSDTEVKQGIDKIKTKALEKGAYVGMYLDITLDKYKRNTEQESWGASTGKLKETKGLIEIMIPIPADLQGKTSNLYRVYRTHDNEPTHTIQDTPNADGEYLKLNAADQTLTLYVKKFSVYALAYLTPASYSVEHYVMNADGNYPASPTKTSSASGLADSVLTVSDLQDQTLSTNGITYGYGTVDGAKTATAMVKGDGSLVIKLYYARPSQPAPASPPVNSTPAPSTPAPVVISYEVTFDGAGGSPASSKQQVTSGSLLKKPDSPTRVGYVFAGWVKPDAKFWNFDTERVYGAVTLSAQWTKVEPPGLDKVNHFAYMQGYPDHTFRSDRSMTRAEVIAMFSRLLTEKMNVDQTYASTFKDVRSSNWYADAVGYMQQSGIIKGYANGTFGPDEPITRAEFAAIASRFDQLASGEQMAFKDVRASYWAVDYIASGAAKGWIKGYPDGTFRPEDYVSRAEAVTLVNRMTERSADRNYVDHSGRIEHYSDLKPAYWAYYDIMEATNRHDYVRGSDGETWAN